MTSCSPVGTHYQAAQRHMPRDRSCTEPTGCCWQCMWPSAPLCTVANSKQYPQLTDIKEQDMACPRRRILLWRTTSCRRVSGRWVQPFRSNIQCWTFESLLGIWHASGYRVARIARLSDSCPALYSEAFCTRPRESGALPSLQLQIKLRRSRHPVFGDKPCSGLCIHCAVNR